MKVYFFTYGCVANYDNTAIMKGILGGMVVDNLEDADAVVFNTCVVKNKTENKIIDKIKLVTKKYPKKKLIITGCMPKALRKETLKLFPEANLVDTNHISEILKVVDSKERLELLRERKELKIGLPKKFEKEASIQIAEGCLGNCTFCITKLAKGKVRSFSRRQIVKETESLVKEGYKRINLTSTDCSCYGMEFKENLVDLLRDIVKIEGNFKVRVGMMNPAFVPRFLDGLIEVYKDDKIMNFLHIPVQSGSNKVLRDMKRGHRVETFFKIVERFRKERPEVHISTDIITGFPTETDDDFKETIELIKKVRPEVLNISKFGPRKGTEAANMKQLDSKIIKKRSVELNKIYKKLRD